MTIVQINTNIFSYLKSLYFFKLSKWFILFALFKYRNYNINNFNVNPWFPYLYKNTNKWLNLKLSVLNNVLCINIFARLHWNTSIVFAVFLTKKRKEKHDAGFSFNFEYTKDILLRCFVFLAFVLKRVQKKWFVKAMLPFFSFPNMYPRFDCFPTAFHCFRFSIFSYSFSKKSVHFHIFSFLAA